MNVDVVIVTYRSASSIESCLASVPQQPGIRTIVVENASGDLAPDLAQAAGAEVVVNPENLGFGAAANQGAAIGEAEAILFLNPDARLSSDALAAMTAELEHDPAVAIVGANLVHPDGSRQQSWWSYPSPGQMWSEALGLHRFRTKSPRGFVVGACFLVRRSAFGKLGGFDQRYWLYGEEADLCYRSERAGFRVVLSTAEVEHIGGESGRESSELVAEHFARGSDRFVLVHHGRLAVVSYRVASVTASLLRWPILRLTRPGDERLAVRTRQIKRGLRNLWSTPTQVASNPPTPRPRVVVVSLEPWDEVWRRNQFFVRELLEQHPDLEVLWVEPPQDVVHDVMRHRRAFRLESTELRPLPGEPRVLRYQPRKWMPRVVWPWVDRGLVRQVSDAMQRAGFRDALVWVNDTTYESLLRTAAGRSMYDITDDWLDAEVPPREHARRVVREERAMRAADAVVVCSESLRTRRENIRPVRLIPNAVDVEHFRRTHERPDDLPAGPSAVYVGTLHEDRLDVELVEHMATALPHIALVFVGPNSLTAASTRRLEGYPNVHLLGPRPYAKVPGYLQHAEVIVIPHAVNRFTESLDPIKAYECLAVGRPTLATPVAGFRDLPPPIRIAARDTFVDQLAGLVQHDLPTVEADVPSWAERAAEFWRVLNGESELGPPTAKTRVVFLDHTAIESGGELALLRLLPGLAHTEPHVILGADGPLRTLLERDGFSVEVLPMDERARSIKRDVVVPGRLPVAAMWSTLRYVFTLRRRLRELEPGLVHTNSLKSALYGGVAARLAGVPVVWHIRDRIADDYLPWPAVRAIRFLARIVPSAIITNSQATRSTLGRAANASTVVPSPVVYDPLPEADPSATVHERNDVLTVGIIGRLAPWKGQDVFLRAFAEAFPNGEAAALVVGGALFGEHEFATELETLAKELGIAQYVTFTGHLSNVAGQLGRMDIVVHASVIPEPFGQVVVEAMAAGKAVIASAAGGPLEIVTPDVDGVLVEPGSVEQLTETLRQLAGDPRRRARLGEAGRRSSSRFAPLVIGADVERLYRKTLANSIADTDR